MASYQPYTAGGYAPPNYNPNFNAPSSASPAYGAPAYGAPAYGAPLPASAPRAAAPQAAFGGELEFDAPSPMYAAAAAPAFDAGAATAAAAAVMFSGDASAGQRLFESQRNNLLARWLPGMAVMWSQFQRYFAVSQLSVATKLRTLFFPFLKRAWRRQRDDEGQAEGAGAAGPAYALPLNDDNAPDLYIPLMAFVTFLLVTGYVKGTAGTFTPEVLANISTRCAIFQCFELALYSTGVYVAGASVPTLDLACYTGYKYMALCVNMLAHLLVGEKAYYAALVYTALASSYFMLKTIAQILPTKTSETGPRREFIVVALGFTQGISVWLLGFNR